ncbi:GNAT family N-acetyltransferase [Rhodovastum atsumiense]|uniref:GNAT family N-acetyltransferase n=1 Tax=Rhodovastum atsumiense TaxID=504468 RepID=A0A5M6IKT4_9PROT|nr:GNAT family protein [Rhodovastum atsumiense]KAA5608883.1 GNAT family N-acetyltransferase [Rhodovastum atsumiense]CAH2602319.1 GNAT family N-acetyltransferase [Rhodovastum atsumiense]
MKPSVVVREARRSDLHFIMAAERVPGFERIIAQWSETQHRAAMASDDHAYLIGTDPAGDPCAFALIHDLHDAHGNVCLRRIAVARPGQGVGSVFLARVVRRIFTATRAHRLWLDVLAENARARHVYAAQGFVEEGRLRAAFQRPDGSRADLVVMSLLRPDWQGRQAIAA